MLKKTSIRLALVIILVMMALLVLVTIYLTRERAASMNKLMREKGITCAKTGATIMGRTFEFINDNGFFTLAELFDLGLAPIDLPERVQEKYRSISPTQQAAIRKYHYRTGLDSYLDNAILEIQDQFLEDPQVVYAALLDKNGYLPVHNSRFSQKLTGEYAFDLLHNRTKRVFTDSFAVRACRNHTQPYVMQVYRRDTGDMMLDFGAPVFVKGHHWGVFRIGFSMTETDETLAALKRRIFYLMSGLAFILVVVVGEITGLMMRPLHHLSIGVGRVASGDLSYQLEVTRKDEVGDLARAFNKMVIDLKGYIANLTETTAIKEKIESELRIAHDIQMGILPKIFPPFPHINEIDLHAILTPAKEVGGDFYDFFLIDDDHLCILIGDVSGKGVPASLLMAVTITLLRAKMIKGMTPDQVLGRANVDLCAENEKFMFVTLFMGILNVRTGELVYSNGGHNPPFIVRSEGALDTVASMPTMALGVVKDFQFSCKSLVLHPQDMICLYTDGVTEAMNEAMEEYSLERLAEDLVPLRHCSAREVIEMITKNVGLFVGRAPQSDDITMITLKYLGAREYGSAEFDEAKQPRSA